MSRDGRRGFDLITFILGFRFLLDSIANEGTPITHSLSMDWDIGRTYCLNVPIIRPYQFCKLGVSGGELEKSCSAYVRSSTQVRRPAFGFILFSFGPVPARQDEGGVKCTAVKADSS